MSPKPSRTWQCGLVSASYWIGFASTMAFSSAYLLDKGFSNTAIGTLIAVSGILSAIIQPLLSAYADTACSPSVKNMILITSGIVVLDVFLLVFCPLPAFFTGTCYCLIMMLLQVLQPLVNSLCTETINQGFRMNFGIARALGSLGYAAAASVVGILATERGNDMIPVCILASFLMLILSTLLYPFHKTILSAASSDASGSGKSSVIGFLRKYPAFTRCLLGLILVYFTHALLNNYTLQIVSAIGGTKAQMGTATSLAAGLELLVMLNFDRIRSRMSLGRLVRISGVFFTLKILATLIAPNMAGFYAVQLLQIPAWGIMAVALVCYVNEIMAPEDRIKGQAFATTVYTIGAVLGSMIGGTLIDRMGVAAMLLAGCAVGAAGSLLIWFSVQANRVDSIGRAA